MNDSEFEAIVARIQQEVMDEAKSALGDKGFDRWRNPKFCGVMADADSMARQSGSCGDSMTMYIKVKGERLDQVTYITDGCGSSSVAGSFTAEMATGRTFSEALALKGEDVLQEIGTFPDEEKHCAFLAVQTLRKALKAYLAQQDAV